MFQNSEMARDWGRRASGRLLLAFRFIDRLHRRPSVCRARNGRGERYYGLKIRPHSHRQITFYLGQLTTAEHQLLCRHILHRWPAGEYRARLKETSGLRQEYQNNALSLAAQCGYRFRSCTVYRCRPNRPIGADSLRRLLAVLRQIRELDGQREAQHKVLLAYLSPHGQRRTCGTLRRISRAMRATDASIRKLGRVLEKEFL